MLDKNYSGTVLIIIFIVLVAVILSLRRNSSQTAARLPNSQTQTTAPFQTPDETAKPAVPTAKPAAQSNNAISTSGGERGQITCNYQIPATPNQFGTASIESNWNNLVLGKNGTAKIDICVSVNGNNSLMSTDLRQNGESAVSASWISLNSSYTFNLYDDHGGDIGTCGGVILSTCQINTNR